MDSKTCGIYAIWRGERVYVGSSAEIQIRWKRHKSRLRRGVHHNHHLQNVWNKYGEDAFEFVVLEECAPECLIEREQHYIDLHPIHYNVLPASGSRLGVPHSPETKAKIGAARRGSKHSPEARAKIGAANARRVVSDETKAKIRAAAKAQWKRKRAGADGS